ncbi:citryl-CoA lyase [Ponticoccus litoralis]|uniref:citrate synthase (unknown stereospecificity) n=1 Tax=Ponticoccus litoralis TaxID=422297 RepID=A0AAW9SRZ0_9RHOB
MKSSPSFWVTSVSGVTSDDIIIRGYPMQELVGTVPFTAIAYLLVRGDLPTPGQARMMDVLCCSILDYGLQKSGTLAARSIVSVNPRMSAGLSAAMLGAGEFAVSPEPTGRFIEESYAAFKASGESIETFAAQYVDALRAAKKRVPGFGHPVFRGVDPRAEKLKTIAIEAGIWGEKNEWYEAVHRAFQKAANKPDFVMNDVGMLAGIMAQMGFTPAEMEGLALMSTMPGLIAHVSEEIQSGAINRLVAAENTECQVEKRDLKTDLAAAGWA